MRKESLMSTASKQTNKESQMAAKIEVFKDADGKWFGHRKASNGKVTDVSKPYSAKRPAMMWAERTYPDVRVIDLTAKEAKAAAK